MQVPRFIYSTADVTAKYVVHTSRVVDPHFINTGGPKVAARGCRSPGLEIPASGLHGQKLDYTEWIKLKQCAIKSQNE